MQLRRYAAVVRRWSWLLLLGAVLTAAAACAFAAGRPETYRATATILINQSEALAGPSYNDILANQQLAKTYGQLVTSADVIGPTAQTLDLRDEELRAALSAQPRADTQLLDISATSGSAESAARIANEAATVLVRRIREGQLAPQFLIENDLETQAAALQRLFDTQTQTMGRLSRPQPGLAEEQRLAQFVEAQAQADATRLQLATLRQRLADLRIAVAKVGNDIQVVDPAEVPAAPSGPSVLLTTLLGAVLGLLLAGAVVAVVEHLNGALPGPDAFVRATGVAVAGAIPPFRGPRRALPARLTRIAGRRPAEQRVLTEKKAHRPVWDAYRVLRMNLEFARAGRWGSARGSSPYALLVTSAIDGEGKSTTAVNLALVLARAGRRVVLVDADLRRPSLHARFGLSNDAGLSSFLTGTAPGEELTLLPVPGDGPGRLTLLPAGPAPDDPAELLSSTTMTFVLESLRNEADVVVVDSSPLLGATDALALAQHVDGVILVVDATRTGTGAVAEAAALLRRTRTPLWGLVLNKLTPGRSFTYQDESPVEEPAAEDLALDGWRGRPRLRRFDRGEPEQPEQAAGGR